MYTRANKYLFFFLFFATIIFLYSLSYLTTFYVSMYAIVFFSLLLTQLIFSKKNRQEELSKLKSVDVSNVYVDLLVVGYREDPDYWEKCLQSIKNQNFDKQKMNICVSIDGNSDEDLYMFGIASTILPDAFILTNEHGGKRSAIAHGYHHLLNIDYVCRSKFIVIIDSDTILDKDSLTNLVKCIESDDSIGCATGNIKIFNKINLLTRIINARYAYAFNIERSYQSYFNIMTCCSGPLSIYRKSLITRDFIEKFRTQSIAGNHIEPGDDRHQTLMILSQGFKSRMTPFSVCWTESPESFERFLRQQLRWMRSFYREQYWQFKALKKQPYILSVISTYELLFPFFVVSWIVFLLFFKDASLLLLLKSFAITIFVSLLKTVFLVLETKNISNSFNFLYLFIYLLFLIPAKLYAVFTLLDNNWKTSDRLVIRYNFNIDTYLLYSSIILWNACLLYGCANIVLSNV
jgi:hyaluronan synthase